jgi:hypothetical protein
MPMFTFHLISNCTIAHPSRMFLSPLRLAVASALNSAPKVYVEILRLAEGANLRMTTPAQRFAHDGNASFPSAHNQANVTPCHIFRHTCTSTDLDRLSTAP